MSSDEEESPLQLTESGHIKIQSVERETTRLEVYSDAIFSIISTITILPAIEELRDGGTFDEIQHYIFLYIFSYEFIVLNYREHNFKFNRLIRFDFTDVIANAFVLVILGFFPFSNILLLEYYDGTEEEKNSIIPILIQAIVVLMSSFANFLITLWVERKSPFEKQTAHGYVRIVRDPLSLLNVGVGALMKFLNYFIGSITVLLLFLLGCKQYSLFGYLVCILIHLSVRKLLLIIDRTQYFDGEELSSKQLKRMRKDGLFFQKERAMAFADGIFAIAGTIVAVNLRPPELEEGETLVHGLYTMLPQFLSYLMSFLLLAFWWFLNWRMMLKVPDRVPFTIHIVNLQFLCLAGALPVAAESIGVYARTPNNPGAISLYCVIVFIAGIFQMIQWILILRMKRTKVSARYRALIFAGIAIGPITAIPSFFFSYFDECVWCLNLASILFLFVPFIGLFVYLISSKKVEKKLSDDLELNL